MYNTYLQLYIMTHMIYTCNLYMPVSRIPILFLVFGLLIALALAQDSHQIPTASSPTEKPSPSHPIDHQVAQDNPSSHQTPQNSDNFLNSAHITADNENIVTENDQHRVDVPQATQADVQIAHEQLHGLEHEQATENQILQHHDESKVSHEHIRKMLSQMTQQQLAAFQEGLQADAREYYRQIMQEEVKHQHQEQLQYQQQYAQIEEQLSKTDILSEKQAQQFQKQQQKFESQLIAFNDYLFELEDDQTETFRITLPVTQRIIFHGYTYENNEGVYTPTSNVEDHQPITFRIYENDQKIVYQKQFYFKYFGSFIGNENSTYIFRFYNPSQHKLIALSISTIFQKAHAENKITANDVADHSRRIVLFQRQIMQRYNEVMTRSALQNLNRETLMNRLDHYYIFSFIQLGIMLGVCVVQVQFVKKILSSNNIV